MVHEEPHKYETILHNVKEWKCTACNNDKIWDDKTVFKGHLARRHNGEEILKTGIVITKYLVKTNRYAKLYQY